MVEESDLLRGERYAMGCDLETWVYFICSECGVRSQVNGYPGDPYKLATHASLAEVVKRECPTCGSHSCPAAFGQGGCYNVPA